MQSASTTLNVSCKCQLIKFKNQSFKKRQVLDDIGIRRKSADCWLASEKEKRLESKLPIEQPPKIQPPIIVATPKTFVSKFAALLKRNEIKTHSYQSNETGYMTPMSFKRSQQIIDFKPKLVQSHHLKTKTFDQERKNNIRIYIRRRTNCVIQDYITEQSDHIIENLSNRIRTQQAPLIMKKFSTLSLRNQQLIRCYTSNSHDFRIKSQQY